MIISATRFEDKQFEMYLTIDPNMLEKEVRKQAEMILLLINLIAIISIAAGIGVAIATVILSTNI